MSRSEALSRWSEGCDGGVPWWGSRVIEVTFVWNGDSLFPSIVDEMRFNGANALEVERSRVRIHLRIRCSVLSVRRRKGLSCASTCRNTREQASTVGTSDLGMVGFNSWHVLR